MLQVVQFFRSPNHYDNCCRSFSSLEHLIIIKTVAGYSVLRATVAVEDMGRWKNPSAENGLAYRSNDRGGKRTEEGYDGPLSGEEHLASQSLGLQVLFLRVSSSG